MVKQIEVTDALVTFVMDDEGGTVISLPQQPSMMNDFWWMSVRCLANSERWFPDLFETERKAMMHFALGLGGELGEAVDAAPDDVPLEMADCAIYLLDICGFMGHVLDPRHRDGWTPDGALSVYGSIANKIKKWNRDETMTIGALHMTFHDELERLWSMIHFRHALYSTRSIFDSIEAKIVICNDRWGWP